MAQDWTKILQEEIAREETHVGEINLTPEETELWSSITTAVSESSDTSLYVSDNTNDLLQQLQLQPAPPEDLWARLEIVADRALRDAKFLKDKTQPTLGDYISFLRVGERLRVDQVAEDVALDYDLLVALEANKISYGKIRPWAVTKLAHYLKANYDLFIELLPSLFDRRGPALATDTGLFRALHDLSPAERAQMMADAGSEISDGISDTMSAYRDSVQEKEQKDFDAFVAEVKSAWKSE
ncbi:MAG: hypothetical protein NT018_07550 [Armatimonadetes bacterium]|nr:hypothetical protein [Armatimonadota bacterium]